MSLDTYLRFVIALAFVLALIGLLAWAARRFGVLRGATRPRKGERRIEVVEILPVDAKRRLVLLRRDRIEHLVLLGATGELLVESGIVMSAAATVAPHDPRPEAVE